MTPFFSELNVPPITSTESKLSSFQKFAIPSQPSPVAVSRKRSTVQREGSERIYFSFGRGDFPTPSRKRILSPQFERTRGLPGSGDQESSASYIIVPFIKRFVSTNYSFSIKRATQRQNRQLQELLSSQSKKMLNSAREREFVEEKEKDTRIGVPRPPIAPRPSKAGPGIGIGTFGGHGTGRSDRDRDLTVNSYNLMRPALLEEVNAMVATGLRRLEKEKDRLTRGGQQEQQQTPQTQDMNDAAFCGVDAGALENKMRSDRLDVYRNAFQHYIESSTLFKPFLREVLVEFESMLASLGETVRRFSAYEMEKAVAKATHASQTKAMEQKFNTIIASHMSTADVASKKVREQAKVIEQQQQECETLRASTAKYQAEWDEMRTSCITLTKSLQRYTEANKVLKQAEAMHLSESTKLVLSERKATEECERLRLKKQELEAENSLLVSHEELEKKTLEIDALRRSMRYQEDQHKLLLQRYGLVKSAIERVYKKQLPLYTAAAAAAGVGAANNLGAASAKGGGASLVSMASTAAASSMYATPDAGRAEGNGAAFLTAMADQPEVVADAIGRLGGDIRGAMEALLDHIRVLSKNMAVQGVNAVPDSGVSQIISSLHSRVAASAGKDTQAEIEERELQCLDDGGAGQEEDREMLDEVPMDSWPTQPAGRNAAAAAATAAKGGSGYEPTDTGTAAVGAVTNTEAAAAEAAAASAAPAALFEHFEGLGDDMNIPAYLRLSGPIQNLFFRRTDTARLLHVIMKAARARKEFLQSKLAEVTGYFHTGNSYSASLGGGGGTVGIGSAAAAGAGAEERLKSLLSQPFSVFFEAFLRRHFQSDAKVVQIAFNLLESCKKYSAESDCRLFLLILNDELPPDVWYDQDDTFSALCAVMKTREASHGQLFEGRRRLGVDDFLRTLQAHLPHKSQTSFKRLQRALALENKSSRYVLDIPSLLLDAGYDDGTPLSRGGTGTRGMFCELLRLQHITECSQFYVAVMDAIDSTCAAAAQAANALAQATPPVAGAYPVPPVSDSEATVSTFRKALLAADDARPRADVNAYLSRGMGVALEELLLLEAKRGRFSVPDFKRRLRAGLLKKFVPALD